MKPGKWQLLPLSIVALGVMGYAGFAIGQYRSGPQDQSASGGHAATETGGVAGNVGPVATIHVASVRLDQITEQLEFFGTVIVQQAEVSFISVPLESQLKRILVTPGQRVKAGDQLFELDLSPAARLAFDQAQINANTARAELLQVEQKMGERLATNQELTQAKQAAELANGTVAQMAQLQSLSLGMHKAGFDGVVSRIDAQPGQIVVAGSPIIEVVTDDGIEVQLGVEIEDARSLLIGNALKISAVLADKPRDVSGTIRLTTETIDPQTRLTSVYVSLPPQSGFMLGESIKAVAEVHTPAGLIVPRQAIIPDGPDDVIFLVRDGIATEKRVRIGIDNGSDAEVFSDELQPGDQIATIGNSQLTDGMRVQIATHPDAKTPAAGSVDLAPAGSDSGNSGKREPPP